MDMTKLFFVVSESLLENATKAQHMLLMKDNLKHAPSTALHKLLLLLLPLRRHNGGVKSRADVHHGK